MSFALSNVVSRRAEHLNVESKTFGVLLGTVILTIPLLWWQGGMLVQLQALEAYNWIILAMLGITLYATGYAVQYGIARLQSSRAMLLFLFELVVAAISSYLLADEAMQLRDWLGALLIVSASLLSGKLYAVSKI